MNVTNRHRSTGIETIATEIWDKITDHLPSLSIRYATRALRIESYAKQEKHGAVWDVIFQDSTWIAQAITNNVNPALIGHRLDELYRLKTAESFDHLFMTLVANHADDDKVCQADTELFFRCLRPHSFDKETNEVTFDSGIVLNVESPVLGRTTLTMQPVKLFQHNWRGNLRTFCVYARDSNSELQKIDGEDIVGGWNLHKINRGETLIHHKCALNLKPPLQHKHQWIFERPMADSKFDFSEAIFDDDDPSTTYSVKRKVLTWITIGSNAFPRPS